MKPMKRPLFYVTGTDTGVGKTAVAGWITHCLRAGGLSVAALKPVCTGDRNDARFLQAASGGALGLAEINPWFFRTPLAPLIAARREGRRLRLADVQAHVRRFQKQFEAVVVEGAGGLLSPLGAGFDSRDLILALEATPIVVCPNRLGAINQSLLALATFPRSVARRSRLVLMSPQRPDAAGRTNPIYLAAKLGAARVHTLPWRRHPERLAGLMSNPRVGKLIESLMARRAA
jgi:dethiobiotin synthetase